MHKFIEKNKGIIVTILLLLIVMYGYNFFAPDVPTTAGLAPASGEALLRMSQEIQSVNFEQNLFTTPGYRLLIDFSTEVIPDIPGRINPFASI